MSESDAAAVVEARVEKILAELTAEEKVKLLLHDNPAIERLGLPSYNWWNEALHGVARAGKATVFPQPILTAASFDPELLERIGSQVAEEGRAKMNLVVSQTGGDLEQYQGLSYWTPNINIFRDPRWGRGHETYGEDPYLTGEMGAAMVRGLQGDDPERYKSAACAKHFAVHSGPEADRHSFDTVVGQKDLWETYLPAFRRLAEEGVEAFMGAYDRTNGEPSCGSQTLLVDILRGEWEFQGHVVSDCWAVRDFHEHHKVTKTPAESAALALRMGCDLNCGCTYDPHLTEALEQDLITEENLDVSVRRLLRARIKMGLLDLNDEHPYNKIGPDKIRSAVSRQLACEAAEKSVVLLKNESGALPLTMEKGSLYVAGPHATSAQVLMGNYYGVSSHLSTLLEGVAERCPPAVVLNYNKGTETHAPLVCEKTWVPYEIGNSDVAILAMGLDPTYEGEEGESINSTDVGDRADIQLPQVQIDFVKKVAERETKLVLVLFGGSAIDISPIEEYFSAIIWAGYPGEAGGEALARVIFGDVSPSGRLPITFPKEEHLPDFKDYSMKGRTYRFEEAEPVYPFGFGLTYSSFSYGDATATSKSGGAQVTVTITNTGRVKATDVVQCYLKKPGRAATAPRTELVGIERVELEPGASAQVEFHVADRQLALILNDGSAMVETGEYAFTIGGCSPGERGKQLGAAEPAVAQLQIEAEQLLIDRRVAAQARS